MADAASSLSRRTAVSLLGTLEAYDPAFARERPLFAAAGELAHAQGGPLTRAFLDELPPEFSREPLIVDTMLVWLQAGQGMPTRWFHHELFPGKTEHAFGAANAEAGAEHIACAFGAPSVREFLVGDIPPSAEAESGLHCIDPQLFLVRDARLRKLRDDGVLRKEDVPVNVLHRYGASTFHRVLPTQTPGFHFLARATRRSVRPRVGAFRNAHTSYVTGPWVQEFTP